MCLTQKIPIWAYKPLVICDKMKKFSKRYETFNNWKDSKTHYTDYDNRIIRLHDLYPEANLSQLRGHTKQSEINLKKQDPIPVSERSYYSLSPGEKLSREKSLQVLRDVRKGKSLTRASKERGISVNKVLSLDIFNKIKYRWSAPLSDHIYRPMKINENGREVIIETNDSRIASIIGTYHNEVKKFLTDGDYSGLAVFQRITITDSHRQTHRFETNPSALRNITESREDSEFYDIYY